MEVIQGQILLLVLCLSKLALNVNSLNITTVHYIVPAPSSCPNGRECTDIRTLLNESETYFTSNTKVIFQPGTYIIDSSINKSILVYNVNDLVITGDSTTGGGQRTNSRVTLHCQAEFNIIIVQSENVHIVNLELLQCGASIDLTNYHRQKRSSMYEHLMLPDAHRAEIASQEVHHRFSETFDQAEFATIYLLDCITVTLENTSIEKSLFGVNLLTENVRGEFIISGCSFKGIYRSWYVDKYIDPLAENIIVFYKIKSSQFLSQISGSSEPLEQEAVTIIISENVRQVIPKLFNIALTNTTIQGHNIINARKGSILRMIIRARLCQINLHGLNSYRGKQLIHISNPPIVPSAADIRVVDSKFRDGSNLMVSNGKGNTDLTTVIENLLIHNAIEPLVILKSTAYLRNVVIEGSENTPILIEQSQAFFEGSNKISSCYAVVNLESDSLTENVYTGGIYSKNSRVTFRGEMYFESNTGDQNGVISAEGPSTLIFEGKIVFSNNTGYNGGAIGLYKKSLIIVNRTATVSFIRNYAVNIGGAIYIEYNDPYSKVIDNGPQCFYEPAEWDDSIDYHVLDFVNNTAGEAGDTIFAANGEYDYCVFPNDNNTNQNFPFSSFINTLEPYASNLTTFASIAKRICFCADSRPNCTYVRDSKEVYPGQDIHLSVVAVGIGYGTVSATVRSKIVQQRSGTSRSHLSKLQSTQEAAKYCSGLNYTIHSNPGTQALLLSLYQIKFADALTYIKLFTIAPSKFDPSVHTLEVPLLISLSLKICPAGFQLSQETQSCICHNKLRKNNIGCNINDQTVYRQQSHWLGAVYNDSQNESDVIIYKYCPFDFCKPENMNLRLDNQDEQCSNQRSGVLCGQCLGNLSMVLGTTRCMECSHIWILLILPLSILAGVILVVILTILNLTVAIGTINGLIFYANIVQTNKAVLFPSPTENIAEFSKTFIAWLNLDLGIEVCFYEGLDTYAKALFQFMFPVYIWTIMIIIIVSSHYSTRVAKVTGRNAVQVLATLFLLSYSKILRGIITALSVTTLDYPNESKLVWLPDGNVDYLKGKHIFLFLLALFLLTVLSVPYTSILLFSQCLQRWSNFKVISWIWKVKPLFDAYTGPFKDKHRYWTGLLLLVRVVLYIIYSTNVGGDPAVNLLATCITVACLLTYLVLAGGVYKTWPLTVLECSYLLNTLILMTVALYSRLIDKNQNVLANVSVVLSFLLSGGTVVYHVYSKIKETRLVKRYIQCKQQNSRRNEQTVEGEGLIELQETATPATSQEFYFDKLLNQPLLEEHQPDGNLTGKLKGP